MRLREKATDALHVVSIPITEAIDQMFDQWIAHWDRHGFGFWSIRALEANAILGFGGVMYHPSTAERDDLVLYYRFRPEHWGLGYATEVAQEAIDVAFRLVKAPRVVTKIRAANHASIRVAEKVGLTRVQIFEDGGAPSIRFRLENPAL